MTIIAERMSGKADRYGAAPVETEQVMISQLQDTVGRFVGALSEVSALIDPSP